MATVPEPPVNVPKLMLRSPPIWRFDALVARLPPAIDKPPETVSPALSVTVDVNVDARVTVVRLVVASTTHARVGVPLNCPMSSEPGGPDPLEHDQLVEVEKAVLVPPVQVHVLAAACPAPTMTITPTVTPNSHRVVARDHARTVSER